VRVRTRMFVWLARTIWHVMLRACSYFF